MNRVDTTLDDVFKLVLIKARDILRNTAPVNIKGKLESLCEPTAIDGAIKGNKLRHENWYMNNLDRKTGFPTDETDAFVCFGTLDFNDLFYLNKEFDGAEDFQISSWKELVRAKGGKGGAVAFSNAEYNSKKKEYNNNYEGRDDLKRAVMPWFKGFVDKNRRGIRYSNVCMLHWVAKAQNSKVKRLFSVAENIILNAGFSHIFLQVGCKWMTKLAAQYAKLGLNIVMITEEKDKEILMRTRRQQREAAKKPRPRVRRGSVLIKEETSNWGFVFWGWKRLSASAGVANRRLELYLQNNLKF